MEIEIWRTPIHKGKIYDNYQVSNLGRMMNLNYRGTGKAKLMEPYEKGRKYLQVSLSKNEKKRLDLRSSTGCRNFSPKSRE